MKVFSQIFLVCFMFVMVSVIMNLHGSFFQAKHEYASLEQKIYKLYVSQDQLTTNRNVQNDYVNQFANNEEFIEQMVREKTGRLKSNEIVYKFED